MTDSVNNVIVPNNFESEYIPIGTPEELERVCIDLETHISAITRDECVDAPNLVYAVTVRTNSTDAVYFVNDWWHNRLLHAAGIIENNNTQEVPMSLGPEEEELLESVMNEVHQEIPENSATITIDETTRRFSGAIWYKQIQEQVITLAGLGGIGSYCAFLLARMKPKELIMYDPDRVETVNMSGQLYSTNDIGSFKTVAIGNMIKKYADYYDIVTVTDRFSSDSASNDIMICGFDNMEARKTFYNVWKNHVKSYYSEDKRKNCLFIDGRLNAEEYQVLAIQGNDERAMKEYEEKWLFSDEEAEETVCSYKQTTFMANMIASTMVNIFVNFIANQCNPIIDRDVPFFISYDASTMFTKVVM